MITITIVITVCNIIYYNTIYTNSFKHVYYIVPIVEPGGRCPGPESSHDKQGRRRGARGGGARLCDHPLVHL